MENIFTQIADLLLETRNYKHLLLKIERYKLRRLLLRCIAFTIYLNDIYNKLYNPPISFDCFAVIKDYTDIDREDDLPF